jgi:hypothetical protein
MQMSQKNWRLFKATKWLEDGETVSLSKPGGNMNCVLRIETAFFYY